eukprot:116259_1
MWYSLAMNQHRNVMLQNNTLFSNMINIHTTDFLCDGCEGEIQCGQVKTGQLHSHSDIGYYYFNLSTNVSSVFFDSCGSDYDTSLYLFDITYNQLHMADDEGNCGYAAQLLVFNLKSNEYILGISGSGSDLGHAYGNWKVSVNCDTKSNSFCGGCKGQIKCTETLFGQFYSSSDIDYYYFNLSTNASSVTFDSCSSTFDTYIDLFDLKHNQIYTDDGLDCIITQHLPPNEYILGIGWNESINYGTWQLNTKCNIISHYTLIDDISPSDLSSNDWFHAEIQCEKKYGTALATIITEEDTIQAKSLIQRANYWPKIKFDGIVTWVPIGLF